jgi:DNA-binding MarR family transcriptional regulator
MMNVMVLVDGPHTAPATDEARTEATVGLFLSVMARMHQHVVDRSAEFDLSAPQARALHHLGQPRTMGELAEMLCCDASNVTGIIDRLEARGVVERQVVPGDRRVKRIVLTRGGRQMWQAHHDRLMADVPLVAGLSPEERLALHDLLARVVASSAGEGTRATEGPV